MTQGIEAPEARPITETEAEAIFIAHRAYLAAFDESIQTLIKQGITYEGMPRLFSRYEAFQKRAQDFSAGKKERISLPTWLKRFMRNVFPEYKFVAKHSFRKKLTDQLDGLIEFEPIHLSGLGKAFTIRYAIEFPLLMTRKGKFSYNYFCRSIFELFQTARQEPCWTYATIEELQQVFSACTLFLNAVLPPLEHALTKKFAPWPTHLPPEIPSLGALSAKEAYDIAVPIANNWAQSHELQFVSLRNGVDRSLPDFFGVAIDNDGRLRRHGLWTLHFRCPATSRNLILDIPHTGFVRKENLHIDGRNNFKAVGSTPWVDSVAIAATFETQRSLHVAKGIFQTHHATYELHLWDKEFPTWRVDLTGVRVESQKRDDLSAVFDARTGAMIETRF